MEKAKDILFIRDLFVKLKKDFVDNKFLLEDINFTVREGEILSIVGESGSGKSLLAKAITGLQPITNGSVHLDNKIIFGKIPNMYAANTRIQKILKLCNKRQKESKTLLEEFIEAPKPLYFKFVRNYKYNHRTKKIKPYKNKDHRILDTTIEKMPWLTSKYGFQYSNFIVNKQLNLNFLLKSLIKEIEEQERMHARIDISSPLLSKIFYNAYIDKLMLAKKHILAAKSISNLIYKQMVSLGNVRKNIGDNFKTVEDFYKSLFKYLDRFIQAQNEIEDEMKIAREYCYQVYALSSKTRRRIKFFNYYNKLINLSRSRVKKDFTKFKNQLEFFKKTGNEKYNEESYNYFSDKLKNLWHEKLINIKNVEKYFSMLDKSVISVNTDRIEEASEIIKKLKSSDFEESVIEFHNNKVIKNDFTVSEIKKWVSDIAYMKRIMKRNIVTDRDVISHWYDYKNKTIELSEEKINEYEDLMHLMGIPSFNETAKSLPKFRNPSKKQIYRAKKTIQILFKNPLKSMNGNMTIEEIVGESLNNFPELYKNDEIRNEFIEFHNNNLINKYYVSNKITVANDSDVKRFIVTKVLQEVGFSPEVLSRHPHDFFEEQIQRISMARALVLNPKIIVVDEAVSRLNSVVKTLLIMLIEKSRRERNISFIVFESDLRSANQYSDRIAIIFQGRIVEIANKNEIFERPLHPYTRQLIEYLPTLKRNDKSVKVYETKERVSAESYIVDLPSFYELFEDHFVLANDNELDEIKNIYNIKDK